MYSQRPTNYISIFHLIKIASKNFFLITETSDNKEVKIGYPSLESIQTFWNNYLQKQLQTTTKIP